MHLKIPSIFVFSVINHHIGEFVLPSIFLALLNLAFVPSLILSTNTKYKYMKKRSYECKDVDGFAHFLVGLSLLSLICADLPRCEG